MSLETAPALLGSLRQLEDHGERGLVGEAALRPGGSMPDGGKRALDWIGGAQVLPMLGGEVIEREQRIAILDEAFDGLFVFEAVGRDERIACGLSVHPGLGHPDVLECAL